MAPEAHRFGLARRGACSSSACRGAASRSRPSAPPRSSACRCSASICRGSSARARRGTRRRRAWPRARGGQVGRPGRAVGGRDREGLRRLGDRAGRRQPRLAPARRLLALACKPRAGACSWWLPPTTSPRSPRSCSAAAFDELCFVDLADVRAAAHPRHAPAPPPPRRRRVRHPRARHPLRALLRRRAGAGGRRRPAPRLRRRTRPRDGRHALRRRRNGAALPDLRGGNQSAARVGHRPLPDGGAAERRRQSLPQSFERGGVPGGSGAELRRFAEWRPIVGACTK